MLRVYTRNEAADDLIVMGKRRAHMTDGKDTEIEFCARLVFKRLDSGANCSSRKCGVDNQQKK